MGRGLDRFHSMETRDLHDPRALAGTGAVIPAEELASAVHLVLPEGRVLKGFDAFGASFGSIRYFGS